MPVISVIVPVYNVEKYLNRCVDSILSQSFTDFELILVDDGSPDNCGIICDEYEKKESRVHVIHQKNSGLSAARNSGIQWAIDNSDSKFITFIDSDDWITDCYLESMYKAYTETGKANVIVGYERVTDYKESRSEIPEYRLFNTEEFYCDKRINATIAVGKLFLKKDLETLRFPLGKLHEDEYTTYRILFKYEQVVFIDAPLYKYFYCENGITLSAWKPKRLDSLGAYEEQMIFFRENEFRLAYKSTVNAYAGTLAKSIRYMQNGDYGKLPTECRKKLLKLLRKNKKYMEDGTRNNRYVVQAAHPVWWKIKKFIRKKMSYVREILFRK